ncbi:YgfZ/GcvT domain-containing protein [Inmirania thermothiophila]|uniref:Uncharacterized protein n=1 Tax=Inmirania thermothiophila TaxID=1750597 RepID=A0A3N1XZT2_9GAMM|nr:folate-binding protein YgfZ [Inmirania thermothiophila]ROR32114.1 hypothetical protein EDC57_1305 [Inmirania thermothiophila]
MQQDWQAWLDGRGARRDEAGAVRDFGAPEAAQRRAWEDAALLALDALGVVRVTGRDARTLLQGQLTCDLAEPAPGRLRLGAHCNHQGRVLAVMRILEDEDGFCLVLPAGLVDPLARRLAMFVLRSDARVAPAPDRVVTGVMGPAAPRILAAAGAAPPPEPGAVGRGDGLVLARVEGAPPRILVLGPADAQIALWERLAAHAAQAGPDPWFLGEIRAGVGHVFPATSAAFLPQMLNLELVGGVSFRKGCYSGQEVVARAQFLGEVKRRMVRVALPAAAAPGDEVFTADGQAAGRIVDARPTPEGGHEALAVLTAAAREAGRVRLGTAGGPALTLLPLPYPIRHLVPGKDA